MNRIAACAALATAHGALPLILVPQFGEDDERDRALRERILDRSGVSYLFVEIEPTWRIPWDRHPDARAARASGCRSHGIRHVGSISTNR